eukprot:6209063-Pleurochrysis_carterae.AAC.1
MLVFCADAEISAVKAEAQQCLGARYHQQQITFITFTLYHFTRLPSASPYSGHWALPQAQLEHAALS